MNTNNETVQKLLSEGLKAARAAGISKESESDYCAAYLAGKLAAKNTNQSIASQFRVADPHQIKRWILNNPGLFHETTQNLDRYHVASLTEQPATLGAYVLTVLHGEMRYQEGWSEPLDTAAQDDERQGVRDYRLDEIGVC